jgi:uncharacterized protein (PEP-CTERM system associated)
MALRRTRLIASSIFVAASIGGVRVAAQAQDWTITGAASDQEQFTDNVFYTPTNTRSDLITQLSPSINITGESNRLQGVFNYSPTLYLYALTPSQDLLGHSLYGNGTATIVPDTLFLDARGTIARVPSTPGLSTGALGPTQSFPGLGLGPGAVATTGIPTAQLTQTMSFSASPYLVHRFDGFGSAELRYTLTNTELTGGTSVLGTALPNTNVNTSEGTAIFLTGENFGRFLSKLTLDDAQSTGTGIFSGASSQLATLDSGYALTRRWTLLATIGHEDIRFGGTPPTRIDDVVWGAGVQFTPSLGSTIRVSYGRRNGTTAPAISVIYSLSPMTTLTASYSTGLSTTAQDIADNLAVSGVNAAGQLVDTRTLLPLALVNTALGVQTGLFRIKQFTGTADLSVERNHFSASLSESENALVAQGAAGTATSQNEIGGTFNWAREIGPRTTANLGFGYTHDTFPTLGIVGGENLLTVSASINYMLSASLTAWAGYNRFDRSSPDPTLRVSADLVFAGLSKTF